jgi:hypothetical protein
VTKQQETNLRERHRARPARPYDKSFTDNSLEGRHLLADRGLAVTESDPRATKRSLRGDRSKRVEIPKLDTRPALHGHGS